MDRRACLGAEGPSPQSSGAERFLPLRFSLTESASWLVGMLLDGCFLPHFEAAFLPLFPFTAGGLCEERLRFLASGVAGLGFFFPAPRLELLLAVVSFDCVTLVSALLQLLPVPRGPVRGSESLAVAFVSLLVDGIGDDSFPLAFSRVFLGASLTELLPPSLLQLLGRGSELGADGVGVRRSAGPVRPIVEPSSVVA